MTLSRALTKKEELTQSKRFLGQLPHAGEPEPYYIADLINNAKRRGTEERTYDDAVASACYKYGSHS